MLVGLMTGDKPDKLYAINIADWDWGWESGVLRSWREEEAGSSGHVPLSSL